LEGKKVAGNYVVKLDQLNSYTVHITSTVLNDEATVTDATADATLTGGGALTIPINNFLMVRLGLIRWWFWCTGSYRVQQSNRSDRIRC
jgi:hypothetical protein